MPTASESFDFFVSYARADNTTGWITRFIEALQEEQRRFTGRREFRVFFDKSDIRSLDDWRHRLHESLAASRLMVAFISPNYFASEWCRREWRTWIDIEIAKHILSDGAAPVYIVEVPWLAGAMSEQQIAEAITQLSPKRGCSAPTHDVIGVSGQISKRQLTQVRPFYRDGLEALRREDLRKVLVSLAKDLSDRSEHVRAAADSRSTIPPYNRRFVGRLEELTLLRERLHQGRTGVISGHKGDLQEDKSIIASVHGLGGIGKTELAFTYAHAFAGLYPGGRFLVPCDGRSDLRQAMLALDEIFRAEISDEQRKTLDLHFGAIRDCLRRRLQEMGRILLVLDNVTDAAVLSPEQTDSVRALGPDLHLLATTRLGAQEGGGTFDDIHWLTLGELSFEDSLRLLEKHRAFDTPEECAAAESIAPRLGGFALCVEVVGAYLGQHPEQSYAQFLATMGLEDLAPVDLAAERSDVVTRRHNNEKRLRAILEHTLRDLSTEAMTALHFASLLPPDHIVLPWLSKLVGDVHPAFATDATAWQRLIARLVSLALLTRGEDGETQALDESHHPRILRCHRLLQDYLRAKSDTAEKAARQEELEALVAHHTAILEQIAQWKETRWELEPLSSLASLWDEMNHKQAGALLNQVGQYWYRLAEWSRSEPLLRRAVKVFQENLGGEHPNFGSALNNLALLLQATNRMVEAESLMRRALAIGEASYGQEHREVANALNNLAEILKVTNRLTEAEPFYRRALAIDEASYGPKHPKVARDLNNLAELLKVTNRPVEAEPLMRRAVGIFESSIGSEHPDFGVALSTLATLLHATNKFAEGESLMRQALRIHETSYGPNHTAVATDLNNLAEFLKCTNRLVEAEPLMRRALAIDEESYGPDHPKVALDLNNLAQLLKATDRLAEAEPMYRSALAIDERSFGSEHPNVACDLNNLARLLDDSGRQAQAEPMYRRALAIDEASYGSTHPNVAVDLNNLAQLLQATNRPAEAEALMRRALTINERSFGPEHPNVSIVLHSLAKLLHATNRLMEAEPMYRQALAIDEASYGSEHPDIAVDLNNLTQLLQATNRLTEAEPLARRSLVILAKFTAGTRHEHPYLRGVLGNYRVLVIKSGQTEEQAMQRVRSALREGGLSLGS
jgi:tetratricopeptide (TPR) repeat protein